MSSNGRFYEADVVSVLSAPKARNEKPAKVPMLFGTVTSVSGDFVTVAFNRGSHWLPGATFLQKEVRLIERGERLSA